jgi:hypothetical protein
MTGFVHVVAVNHAGMFGCFGSCSIDEGRQGCVSRIAPQYGSARKRFMVTVCRATVAGVQVVGING